MKNKIFVRIFFLIVLIFKVAGTSYAAGLADQSASLSVAPAGANKNINQAEYNALAKKREALRRVLEKRQSPLLSEIDAFISTAGRYQLPVYFLPSITGLESSFGQFLMPGYYNPFGWGGGYIKFESWADGIETVGRGIRERYVPEGEITPWKVGPTYAESKTWAVRVESFMKQFEAEEAKIELNLKTIEI